MNTAPPFRNGQYTIARLRAPATLLALSLTTAASLPTARADEPPPLPPASTGTTPSAPGGTNAPNGPSGTNAPDGPSAPPGFTPPPAGAPSSSVAVPLSSAPPGFAPPPGSAPPPGFVPAGPQVVFIPPGPMTTPLAWKPGDPPPPGYKVSEKRPWEFAAGLGVFLGSWGFSAVLGGFALAFGTNKPAAGVFIIPVVGPFVDLAWQKMTTADAVFTGVIGGVQALGAASLIAGIVLPKKQRLVPEAASLQITPLLTPTMQGVGLSASF